MGQQRYFNTTPDKLFTGREEELNAIKNAFDDPACRALVVSGIAGIGKTELVREYSAWNQSWHEFWVDGTKLKEEFTAIAAQLPGRESEDVCGVVKTWLTLNTGWLFIFDNVSSLDILTPYLPDHHSNGFVLITSTSKYWGKIPVFTLGPMTEMDSVSLLKKKLTQEESDENLLALAKKVAGIPEELVRAAVFMNDSEISVAIYLTMIPEINYDQWINGYRNYRDFINPPIPESKDVAFKSSTSKQLIFSLHQYLDNRELNALSQADRFFDALFQQEMKYRATLFFQKKGGVVDLFFRSFRDIHFPIKTKFKNWSKANEAHVEQILFEGNVEINGIELRKLCVLLKESDPVHFSREVTETVTVSLYHDFLPPSLRKMLGQVNVISLFESLHLEERHFHQRIYHNAELLIDFNKSRQQTFGMLVDPTGNDPEASESTSMLKSYIRAFLLQYQLSFSGNISHNGKSISLNDLFPEFVKGGRVVFEVQAPLAYRRINCFLSHHLEDESKKTLSYR